MGTSGSTFQLHLDIFMLENSSGTKTFSLTLHYRTNEPLLEYYRCKLRQAHLSHLSVAVSINYTQLNTVHMSRIHLAKVNTISCPSGHPNFKMTIEKTI